MRIRQIFANFPRKVRIWTLLLRKFKKTTTTTIDKILPKSGSYADKLSKWGHWVRASQERGSMNENNLKKGVNMSMHAAHPSSIFRECHSQPPNFRIIYVTVDQNQNLTVQASLYKDIGV